MASTPGRIIAILALVTCVLVARDGPAQESQTQCPQEIPLYVLIPDGSPCPVSAPKCYAEKGVCRWPLKNPTPPPGGDAEAWVLPGQPCYCVTPNGAQIPGVIR